MPLAIEFEKSIDDALVLCYRPRDGDEWVSLKFQKGETLTLKRTFSLSKDLLLERDFEPEEEFSVLYEPMRFRIGTLRNEYFEIESGVLDVGMPVLLHRTSEITWKWFTAEPNVSIFQRIAELKPQRIVIGGQEQDAIPEQEFLRLISKFPSGQELWRYSLARVSAVVRQYLEINVDAESNYERALAKRLGNTEPEVKDILDPFRGNEINKFRRLHDRLRLMLASETTYSEAAWQAEIIQVIRLLNPKYIKALRSVQIKDIDAKKNRQLDILLVDASGNIDIVEIKKPFGKAIMSMQTYRDNHVPLRELAGAVMQIEKYLYYLNRWGAVGEHELTTRYAKELPVGFQINITNPSGIVILGRSSDLSDAQLQDFEVVKRKYKNVLDIVTYDDLLRRLHFVVTQYENGNEASLS
jgi:hypothetical protein